MGTHNSKGRKKKSSSPPAAWKVTFSKFAILHQDSNGQMTIDHSTFVNNLLSHLPSRLCDALWLTACDESSVSLALTEHKYGNFVQHIEELRSEAQLTQLYLNLWLGCEGRTTLKKSDIVDFFCFCAFQIFSQNALKSDATDSNENFFQSVVASMTADKNADYSMEEVVSWIVRHAPNIVCDINTSLRVALVNGESLVLVLSASLKEALEVGNVPLETFWLLAASLPEIYKKNDIHQEELILNRFDTEKMNHCHLLYDSVSDGLSGSRFRSRVVDYLGPTLLFVWFTTFSGEGCYCLAHDSGWIESWKPYGNCDCRVYEIYPKFRVMLRGKNIFYSNFTALSGQRGVYAGCAPLQAPVIILNDGLYTAELYGVTGRIQQVVVLGCGDPIKIAKLLREKDHARRFMVQKRAGSNKEDWQYNIDREILSLGGVNVRNADLIGGCDRTEDNL